MINSVRKWLETPLANRPILTWPSYLILLPLSLIWGLVAIWRRAWYERAIHSPEMSGLFKVPCPLIRVGNRVAGGTGKSPVVFKLALSFVEKGYQVGVVCRGVGSGLPKRLVVPVGFGEDGLCDEAREMAFKFKQRPHAKNVYIIQGAQRHRGIRDWLNLLDLRFGEEPVPKILIMDDGLQHFKLCPEGKPSLDLCLWDPHSNPIPPFWCLPLGLYREGFPMGVGRLFPSQVKTVWSRFVVLPGEDLETCWQKYKSTLHHLSKVYPQTVRDDWVVWVGWKFWVWKGAGDLQEVDLEWVKQQILNGNRAWVPTGIAQGAKFVKELEKVFPSLQMVWDEHLDHGDLKSDLKKLETEKLNSLAFFTLKDFCRWRSQLPVYWPKWAGQPHVSRSPIWFVVELDVELRSVQGDPIDFYAFLKQSCL